MPLETGANGGLPAWLPETVLWLLVGTFVALLLIGAGVWVLVERLKALREEARSLATLAALEKQVARLIEARDALDLRRIEHLLVDLRDAQQRIEQVLQRTEEGRARGSDGATLLPAAPLSLAERVVNRLLALGFERDVWLTLPTGHFEGLASQLETRQPFVAPYSRGQKAGIMKLRRGPVSVADLPVVALDDVPVGGFLSRGWDTLRLLFR